jgi:hypothetical protein
MVACPYCDEAIPIRRLWSFVWQRYPNAMRCPRCRKAFKVRSALSAIVCAALCAIGVFAWALVSKQWQFGGSRLVHFIVIGAIIFLALRVSLSLRAGAKPSATDYLRLDRESLGDAEWADWRCECSAENQYNTLSCWNCGRPRKE